MVTEIKISVVFSTTAHTDGYQTGNENIYSEVQSSQNVGTTQQISLQKIIIVHQHAVLGN